MFSKMGGSRAPVGQNGRKCPNDLRLIWVEAFIAVADSESQLLAATRLRISQPMVSRHIRDLERWLQKTLFKYKVPAVLNEEGKKFLPTARQVVRLLEESRTFPRPRRTVPRQNDEIFLWKP